MKNEYLSVGLRDVHNVHNIHKGSKMKLKC